MLTGIIAFITAWLPTLAVGAGPLSLVAGVAAKFAPNARTWLIAGGIVLGVVAIAGASIHYMKLKDAAADWHAVAPKISALERELGCPQRTAEERDLFACIPARERDAAQARATALREQAAASARAIDELAGKAKALEEDLDLANQLIDAAEAADDGPVPKVMRDNWARERAKRGVK